MHSKIIYRRSLGLICDQDILRFIFMFHNLLVCGFSYTIIREYKMNKQHILTFSLSFLLFSQAVAQELNYLGSYSFLRASSEHTYISEFRLWKSDKDIQGIFIFSYGLSGDPKPFIEKIISGSLNETGELKFKTKWYQFSGKISGNTLQGILRQNSEVIWGGIKGSNVMTLNKGILFEQINETPNIKSVKELGLWFDKLSALYKTL